MKPFEVIPLFSTPLYLSEVLVDDEIKNLIKNLKFMRMTDDNGDVSVDHYVLSNLKFKNLYDQIMMHVNRFTKDILNVTSSIDFEMKNSWAVRMSEGDYANRHYHNNCLLSGIVYVETYQNSGDIAFEKSPNYTSLFPSAVNVPMDPPNIFNSDLRDFTPKNNQIFIFPSHLLHQVTANFSGNIRYSLAFNFFPKGIFNSAPLCELNLK